MSDKEAEKILDFLVSNRSSRQMRRIIYDRMAAENGGKVSCFVCNLHVQWREATLEHIKCKDRGGTDDESNLSISHLPCNNRKANHVMEKK